MSYYNHMGFNAPDYHDDESVTDVYRRVCQRIYSLPWTTNDDSTMVSVPKDTWREWLRDLNVLFDSSENGRLP